jgi:hypothetical protein
MSVVVVATIVPLPEHRDEVIAALGPKLAGKIAGPPDVIRLQPVPGRRPSERPALVRSARADRATSGPSDGHELRLP